MAVTEASFKALFPEFAATSTSRVERCIEAAEYLAADSVFGDSADMAVSYMAAHLVSQDPAGEPTAQAFGGGQALSVPAFSAQNKAAVIRGTSRYLNIYEQLRAAVVMPVVLA